MCITFSKAELEMIDEACKLLSTIRSPVDFYRVIHLAYDRFPLDIMNAARERMHCYNSAQYAEDLPDVPQASKNGL